MMKNYGTLLMFLVGICSYSQSFEEVETTIDNFYYSNSDAYDYDNDGDLDFIICGAIDMQGTGSADTSYCQIYRNDDGEFTDVDNFSVNSLHLGDVSFIDKNNDGLADVVITGQSYEDITTFYLYIYENTGDGFELSKTDVGAIYSSLEVVDFNFDGKQDFVLNGVGSDGTDTRLFTNVGNEFDASVLDVTATQNGHIRIADLNNDLLPDVIVMGLDADYNELVNVYLNVDGTLTLQESLGTIYNGSFNLADFNADGFLDIVLTGSDASDDYNPVLKVFFNDNNGGFTEVLSEAGIENFSGVNNTQVGDLNNDGYYDFIIAGDYDYTGTVKIYLYNPETEQFSETTTETGIYALGAPADMQLVDFDNDNLLDLMLIGFDSEDPDFRSFTKLFKNTSTEINHKPLAPTTFESTVSDGTITFNWSGASDDKTPVNALQYYFRVGTTPGGKEVAFYPIASNSWKLMLNDIPESFYWGISSIDASKVISEESAEQTFTTLSTPDFDQVAIKIYPNPTNGILNIETPETISEVRIIDMVGKEVYRNNTKTVNLVGVQNGVYFVRILLENGNMAVRKIIKE